MKKMIKNVAVFLLTALIIVQVLPFQANAAPYDFTIREEYDGPQEETIYEVARDQTELRSEPRCEGIVIEYLTSGQTMRSVGTYINNRGTPWIAVLVGDEVYWVNRRHLEPHTHHFTDLSIYDAEGFRVCIDCGEVVCTNADEDTITLEADALDELHLTLALLSLIPGAGEIFDITDLLAYLSEGDMENAAWSAGALLPVFGYPADIFRAAKTVDKADAVVDSINTSSTWVKASKSGNVIKLSASYSRRQLRKNLDNAFEETGDYRYYLGTRMSAHHIVGIGDNSAAAAESRALLTKYGIDLNSYENGVSLCNHPRLCFNPDTALHTGRHLGSYSEAVNTRLKDALARVGDVDDWTKRQALIDELSSIADDLLKKDILLQGTRAA